MTPISQHTLGNGLRLVHLHVRRSAAAHFGFAVHAGSGNERSESQAGLAHFVEHTLFKGTARRNSWHIINRMEAVGGELNAFTTKEDTVVYASFPRNALLRALDLITDLLTNSQFPENELDKEREVICDEINSYLDSPSEAVYDDFEDLLYKGTPLGHNILGTEKSVRNIGRAMCLAWMKEHYTAENMVAFYAGPSSPESFIRKAEPYLRLIPSDKTVYANVSPDCLSADIPGVAFTPLPPFDETRHIDSHQAHTVMGCAMPKADLRRRITLALVTNILGGPGMNSTLNVSLREKRGLVYNVESSLVNWKDSTMFTTYFGTDPEDNEKCLRLVETEIRKIADGSINQRRLSAAKKQYLGQLTLSRVNAENRIISVARAVLHNGYALTASETDTLIAGITPEMVREEAALLLPLSRLTFRP